MAVMPTQELQLAMAAIDEERESQQTTGSDAVYNQQM